MLKSVRIQNFQSHEDTIIKFDKGVNIIVGSSDSGKSAILRSLKLLVWNKPAGNSYCSTWGGKTLIEGFLDDKTVSRMKEGSYNEYRLKEKGKKPLVFKAFGKEVPEEINEILDFDHINFQQQMDSPFLISETPGFVSSHFNKIAKLETIDSSLQNIQKAIRQISSKIEHHKQAIEENENKLNEFSDLEKFEMEVEVLEEMQASNISNKNKLTKLTQIIKKIIILQKDLNSKKKLIEKEASVNFILEKIEKIKISKDESNKLKKLSLAYYYNITAIEKAEEAIRAEPSINFILNLYNKQKETNKKAKELCLLVNTIKKKKEAQESDEKYLKRLETNYIKNFPSVCPFCETKLKK